jgi:hypothetical protein
MAGFRLHSFLTALMAGMLATPVPASTALIFPTIRANDLNGREYVLPRDLAGSRNLIFIGFWREQQREIDTWLTQMPALQVRYPQLRYYEFPVASDSNRLFKPFIDAGMRNGIPDPEARGRTITLFTDKARFMDALRIRSEDVIHAALLDRDGKVLWSAEGVYTDAKARSLESVLKRTSTR